MTSLATHTDSPEVTDLLKLKIGQVLEMPDLLESTRVQIRQLATDQLNGEAERERLFQGIGQVSGMLRDLLDRQSLLEDASKRQQELTEEHIGRHVIEPLLMQIIALFDLSDPAQCAEDETSPAKQLLEAVHRQALEILTLNGCELIKGQGQDVFDPSCMRPMSKRLTGWTERDRKVAESLQPGFRRGARVLRYESVVLYEVDVKKEEKEG